MSMTTSPSACGCGRVRGGGSGGGGGGARGFGWGEPLSNLDAKLRVQTRAELIKLHRKLGITTIYVTHDQGEAMTMGDRIAVLKDGLLQQLGAPLDIFNNPANLFVAG